MENPKRSKMSEASTSQHGPITTHLDDDLTSYAMHDLYHSEEHAHAFFIHTYQQLCAHFKQGRGAIQIWVELKPTSHTGLQVKKIIENEVELDAYWKRSLETINQHVDMHHINTIYIYTQLCQSYYIPVESAFKSRISTGRIVNTHSERVEPQAFLTVCQFFFKNMLDWLCDKAV